MKIAILSGKGGTGKTFLSVNLSAVAQEATYVDCDVEEPNGDLFFKSKLTHKKSVLKFLPIVDNNLCTGCRKCGDICKFNAIAFIGGKPKIFEEICHSCGACKMFCPSHAISEIMKSVGEVKIGSRKNVTVVSGMMNEGEISGVPVIKEALDQAYKHEGLVVVDCPPGSACTAMESVRESDYCVLVAEPTPFGFHNFKMIYEMVTVFSKPCGVVINKALDEFSKIEDFCKENNIKILEKIPYKEELAHISSAGEIAVDKNEEARKLFAHLLEKIETEVRK